MISRDEAIKILTAPGQPYELEEVELYGRTCRAFRNAPPTLRDLYADTRSDLPFIVFEDERSSFEDAWRLACRIGTLLIHEYGVQRAIALPSPCETIRSGWQPSLP